MTSQPNKLAEYAAPTRGRVKYAPLTAGLLARKGEAMPATPYFAAEALDLHAGQITAARHEPHPSLAARLAHVQIHERPIEGGRFSRQVKPDDLPDVLAATRSSQAWRPRQPAIAPNHHLESKVIAQPFEDALADPQPAEPRQSSSVVEPTHRVALALDFDLEILACLALHARDAAQSPQRVIEDALKALFAAAGDVCPTCARALAPGNS